MSAVPLRWQKNRPGDTYTAFVGKRAAVFFVHEDPEMEDWHVVSFMPFYLQKRQLSAKSAMRYCERAWQAFYRSITK